MLEGLRSAVQSPAVAGHEQHSQGSIVGPTLFSAFMNTGEKKDVGKPGVLCKCGAGAAGQRAGLLEEGQLQKPSGHSARTSRKPLEEPPAPGNAGAGHTQNSFAEKDIWVLVWEKKNHNDLSAAFSSAAMKVNCPLGCSGKTGTSRVRKAKALVRINQLQLLVPGTRQTLMHPSKPNKARSKQPGAWTQHTEGLREPGLTQS